MLTLAMCIKPMTLFIVTICEKLLKHFKRETNKLPKCLCINQTRPDLKF